MLPIVDLGVMRLPAYALFVFIGAVAFTITTIVLLEKVEKKSSKVTNSILIISIFGFLILAIGAFIINSFFHSLKLGRIVFGGITWLGGVLVAFPATIFLIHKFCREAKGKPLQYFNFLIPGIVLAHAFGRLGCFFGGCCYGAVTNSFLGVSFPAGSLAAKEYPAVGGGSLPVLPTQLFEACFEFCLFLVMIMSYRKMKGCFFEIYAFSYGTFRFLMEFLRGDNRGEYILFLSPSQVMSLILVVYGALIVLYKKGLIFKKIRQKMTEIEAKECCAIALKEEIFEKLYQLKKMHEEELLTTTEYEERKRQLLDKLIE